MCRVELFVVKDFLTKQSETEDWLDKEGRSLIFSIERVDYDLFLQKKSCIV